MSKHPAQVLHPQHLRIGVKSHFNRSGFACCSHSSTLAIVNHTPFSPKVLDTPTSHNSNLVLESAVAPVGFLTCFIHRASDGVIQKAVIFSPTLFLTSNDRVESGGLPFQQNIHFSQFHILGVPGESTVMKVKKAYADSGRMS